MIERHLSRTVEICLDDSVEVMNLTIITIDRISMDKCRLISSEPFAGESEAVTYHDGIIRLRKIADDLWNLSVENK